MLLKMECLPQWNVIQDWNVTQNGMTLKMECHSKWNVTKNGISLKIECQ